MAVLKRVQPLLLCCLLAGLISFSQAAGNLKVEDLTVSLKRGDSVVGDAIKLSPTSKASQPLVLDHTLQLSVSFKALKDGQAFQPEQAMLRLTSTKSGAAAYFAASKGSGDVLSIKASSQSISKQIGTQGGSFQAAVLLGDAAITNPLEWIIADVTVLYPPLDTGKQPEDPVKAVIKAATPKPEIKHIFRAPEKSPPSIISLFFTVIVLVPCAGFFYVLKDKIQVNVDGFSMLSATDKLYAMGFHGGVLAILVLYIIFFLGTLNLMELLPWLVGVGSVTAVFASKALSSISQEGSRTKQE